MTSRFTIVCVCELVRACVFAQDKAGAIGRSLKRVVQKNQ